MPMGDLGREDTYGNDDRLLPPPESETPMGRYRAGITRGLLTSPLLAGTGPAVPGQLSEEDQFRASQMRQALTDRGVKSGVGVVMDPVPGLAALAGGLPLRGAAALGAGAGQRPPANENTQSVESLADAVRRRLVNHPAAAKIAEEPFLRPLDKARLAATQAKSDQAMKEALFKLGPSPSREEFEKWVLGGLAAQNKYRNE